MEQTSAKVYLLAHTMPVNTLDGSKNPERVVAAAGKLCYSNSNVINLNSKYLRRYDSFLEFQNLSHKKEENKIIEKH